MKFIFTCDDVGAAPGERAVKWFDRVVDWLNQMNIPGTFFWVPKPHGKPSDENGLWMDAIQRARGDGHDFQVHGLTHGSCFEFGVPQRSIRRHAPEMFQAYDLERDKWAQEHTVPALKLKFDEAVVLYERAFGEAPRVFRAPCLGICANAYEAMSQSGLRYSSSRSVNPAATGYVITRKPELEAWQPDYDGKPFEESPGVLELPMLEDLAIKGIEPEDIDLVFNLFKRDIGNYMRGLGDWPFGIFASHYHSIGKAFDVIPRLYERLFDWMTGQGVEGWTTFGAVLE